jgi:hypothetical protein
MATCGRKTLFSYLLGAGVGAVEDAELAGFFAFFLLDFVALPEVVDFDASAVFVAAVVETGAGAGADAAGAGVGAAAAGAGAALAGAAGAGVWA